MLNFKSIAFGLVSAIVAVTALSDVHDLKTNTFQTFIKEHGIVLVEFFAPLCGHCKALAPEYEEAATILKEEHIPLVKVDCMEEAELCKSYGVGGYPSIKVFRGLENVKPYTGARKSQAIISYMTKHALPPVSILTSEGLENFKRAEKIVIVAYFAADDKASNETFSDVAERRRGDYLFGAINDATLAEAEGINRPAIVLYKQFDERRNTFSEKFDKDTIDSFIKKSSIPLVGEVGPETYQEYIESGIPLAYIFAETPKQRAELALTLKPVAEKYRGIVSFATIDATEFGGHARTLNLKVGKWPAFVIEDNVKKQKFPYDYDGSELTAKDIGDFVQRFVDDEIEPSIKSEPIPGEQKGPVTVIVGHTYKEIVLDRNKDVLVKFYAPWSGRCKALAPIYEELASLYLSNPAYNKQVAFGKIDVTANNVPDTIPSFPTIKLFPAGAKDAPIIYDGPYTIEGFAKFIKENGSYKANAYVADEIDTKVGDGGTKNKQILSTTDVYGKQKVINTASGTVEAAKATVSDIDRGSSREHDEI